MFAILAAIVFGLALLLDFVDAKVGDALSNQTLVTAGLCCIALHLVGVGAGWRRRR